MDQKQNIEDIYDLSPLQQAMLYRTLSDPEAGVEVEQLCLALEGELCVTAFRQAWDRVVARHAILRTSFHWKKVEKPVQVVRRQIVLPWTEEDWRDLAPQKQRERLKAALRADREQGFDLTAAPMMRFGLFRLADQQVCFSWSFHHTLLDGHSAELVLEQVCTLYDALRREQELPLPPSRPYRDYILWLREQDLSQARIFWQHELAGFTGPISLGPDRPSGPPPAGNNGHHRRIRLPEPTTADLMGFAERHRLSPDLLVQGAWALLLSRYADQQDVVFGVTVSGRPAELEAQDMIGLFVNVLPMRVRVAPRKGLLSWLQQLEAWRRQARLYEHVPLAEIHQWSEVPSNLPLFETVVACERAAAPTRAGGNGHLKIRVLNEEPALPYPLGLSARFSSQLELKARYEDGRFDPTTCELLLGHLRTLLEALAADPWQELRQVPLLRPAERRQLLSEWNDTAAEYPRHQGCHELFEAQARRSPTAPAVVFAARRLSYRQLNQRANQLAHRLGALGVGPERPVAICMERSPEMVAGLLAVLKAGGFYVPLDPAYPRQRLAHMLDDARPLVLLTQKAFSEILPEHQAFVLRVEEDWQAVAGESAENPGPRARPDNLAYTIYTSGSTGRPKGVQISHRSLVNFLETMRRQPGLTKRDAVLAVTTISFDIAGLELYLPLIAGGRVELASREEAADGGLLADRLRQSGATVMQATPATWQMLLRAGWDGSPGLKILCGGEALPRTLADQLVARGAGAWNLYGPTETTVWSAVRKLDGRCGAHESEPIGRPIGNTRIYLLDRHLQPLPAGIAGELTIGGDGLARGYRGLPALSAERFIPDELSGEPGARLYRTGDLARYRPDGTLEFLGRTDHQVKVRGFRIELGEIEAALLRHPGVDQAAVAVREATPDRRADGDGDLRLVAYLVTGHEPPPTADELRRFLRERLPDYMVPSVFMPLPALPLTPNGKVDRRSLPAPQGPGLGIRTPYAAPGSEAEQTIAVIWQELLGIDKVGVDDNFFDLGGHSLLLGQLLAKLRAAFGSALSMVDLFRNPTVRALAERLAPAAQQQPAADPIAPSPSRRPQPATVATAAGAPATPAIAVIGMAGRFPGARNVEELWRNLGEGIEGISFFSDDELLTAGATPEWLSNPDLVKARGVLEDAFLFDASFFGMNPGEAELTDPQHRIFLETAWEALENAGYVPESFAGAIGVYGGASYSTYWGHLLAHRDQLSQAGDLQIVVGNDKDYLPARVSYKLNLRGPSVSVQTACSTSLVAIHEACQGLVNGECDMALAGGVSISMGQQLGYPYQQGSILSPDGHCRAFDAKAQGTVPGSGAGIVVLKRLEDALADGDPIRAVIRGSAINNDGSLKVGFTAPSVEGQAAVITEALTRAGVGPETVTLIEAHGTGTALGDPIEIAALTQAFGPTARKGYCALGSVKSNLGHLDAAAGVTGFIKATLALEHAQLPPSLHFEQPNPEIDFEHSPFFVNTRLRAWENGDFPRRAGVSSFGLGGTNAHVVLEQAPAPPPAEASRPWQLLTISARSASALEGATAALAAHLEAHPDLDLADVAYTLRIGRRAFGHRRCLVCRDREEALEALRMCDSERVRTAVAESAERPVVLMFPGQGAQHPGMARELYDTEPAFQEAIDECAQQLVPHLGQDLREVLYPAADDEASAERLQQTVLAQPALFVVEVALARLLSSWGVEPQAMIGHSIGEYTAACLAGVFSLPAALELVAARGRLMQQQPGGAMLSLSLPPEKVRPLLAPELSLAAVNEPGRSVISGPAAAVAALERQLIEQGVICRRLHTSHAFHSEMMEPMLGEFADQLRRADPQTPRIPFISNLTGTWITPQQATDPDYWTQHLRRTVQFSQGIGELLEDPAVILLEVGPGRALTTAARSHDAGGQEPAAICSLAHPRDGGSDLACLLEALGGLWIRGGPVDWRAFDARERRRRVPLPSYPFERECYRFEPAPDRRDAFPPRQQEPIRPASEEPTCASLAPAPPPATGVRRQDRLLGQLLELYATVTRIDAEKIRVDVPFLELGLDSLHLLHASHLVDNNFGVRIPFRQLLTEITTLSALAEYLDRTLPPEEQPEPEPPAAPLPQPFPTSGPLAANSPDGGLEALLSRHLEMMAEQSQTIIRILSDQSQFSQVLSQQLSLPGTRSPNRPVAAVRPAVPRSVVTPPAEERPGGDRSSGRDVQPAPYVPHRPARTDGTLSAHQQAHLDALVERLNRRYRHTKRLAQEQRPVLADGRASAGFQLPLKELLYPVYFKRGAGARVWDVDDNEYVDLTMGFGTLIFGHSPPFTIEALQEQSRQGLGIGLESSLAGEAAQLLCEMTGCERAAFVNSGTEAVITALRLARNRTGRSKIAIFEGGYHGFLDEGLVSGIRDEDGEYHSMIMVPGVPNYVADHVMVLEYCSPRSIEVLKGCVHELAAVMVEPQQSRRAGGFEPGEFLRELREVTAQTDTALILDEVITGFRIHPGGAQAIYGIQADIVTYGKGIGAGVPAAAVAGKAEYLDGIDGGTWGYGDASYPQAESTFVAGTFFKHPLTMAVVHAVLRQFKQGGPQLQQQITQRAERLAGALDEVCEREQVPIRVLQWGSICNFLFLPEVKHPGLFYAHMLENGVYVREKRPLFLSTAHTDEDVDRVIAAFKTSIGALREGGFLPAPEAPAAPRRVAATEAQRELYTVAQLGEDASRAYNEGLQLRWRGPLRPDLLRRAVRQVAERHEVLRATFSPTGDELHIAPRVRAEVALDDLTAEAAESRRAAAARLLAQEADQPFDLRSGPLFRFRLLKMGEDDHILAATFHHAAVDGLSVDVLFHEITALYAAACQDEPCRLPDPLPFGEFADRQRRWQEGPEMAAAEAFWLAQFADAVPVPELPTDRPRPPWKSYAGAWRQMVVGARLHDDLQRTSTRRGGTLFVTLLAAFQLLLHRLSGQDDLVVGAGAAGQATMGDQPLVGHCVNLLPVRSRLRGNPSFAELLDSLRGRVLEAHEHQNYPFSQLVHKLNLPVDPSRSPLLAAVMNLDRASSRTMRVAEAEVEFGANRCRGAKFDLFIDMTALDDAIEFHGNYNTDLFDGATIGRWLGYLRNLLEAIAQHPEQGVRDLPLLPPAERHQLLWAWNDTRSEYPQDGSLGELFGLQAARRPEAVAVVAGDQSLSYGELDARSNQLARHLRKLGVGPEVMVAICMESSPEVLVGILAILKAGGIYVPLDPSYPRERLAVMLEDVRPRVLLTQERLAPKLARDHGHLVCQDAEWDAIARESAQSLAGEAAPEQLAYVMYTSGSTGRPKGIGVPQRAVVRLVRNTNFAEFGPQEVFLQFAPISFDASTLEIWGPLLHGGRLAIVPAAGTSLQQLGVWVARYGITIMWLTAGLFHQMVEEHPEGLRSLRQLLAGGDVLSVPHVEKALSELVGIRLINGYGPTENTTFTCCHAMRGRRRFSGSVPIGRPIANTQIYLLDRRLQPVPVGVVGGLYAGGDGLARGYLNRPGLTAERFIPHPFAAKPGARLYETGDLARQLPDGEVVFVGRMDHQVKIRGFRIELGEIEAALGQEPAVQEAVVVVREGEAGDKRLAAYVVPRAGQQLVVNELWESLRAKLPEYMVPGAFVTLEALPLTPSGKVDRRALEARRDETPETSEHFVAPRNPTEASLAKIWGRVLGVERVGVHDNFFFLGGHSLLATRMVSYLRREFGMELPLRALFEAPSIAELAPRIDTGLAKEPPPPIRRVSRDGRLPLSFAQQRLWFLDRLTRGSAIYNIAAAWQLSGPLDVAALRRSFDAILDRHEALRTRFPSRLGQPSQVISPAAVVALPVIDLRALDSGASEAEARRLAIWEARRSFDLDRGPLLRATLLQWAAEEAGVLVTMHHIVSDGWSMGVFLGELTALYEAFSQRRPSPLPDLPIQYADFAAWQRNWLEGEVIRDQLAYWEHQLAEVSPLDLVTDRPRPAMQTFRGQHLNFQLPAELAGALHALSQRHGATLYMTLLAGFQTLLHRYTGQTDIVVGSPIANRNHPEVEALIGFFVNILAMRADASGNPAFGDFMDRVSETALEAYAHQELSFEKLVEHLQPERDLSRNPIFQVMFALQNAPLPATPMAELTVQPLAAEAGTTRFDIELHVWESQGELSGTFAYDADLFEASTIRRLAGHFQTLLEGIVADPCAPLSALPILGEAERSQLQNQWAGSAARLPSAAVVHELFEARAAATPAAVAAVFDLRHFSYGELNARANQLAHFLERTGVGPEVRVAICMDRSMELLMAILAILKAGGTYVPLDADYPRERLDFMLLDCRARVILTCDRRAAVFSNVDLPMVNLDSDWPEIAQEKTANPSPMTDPENLAYVMYTSGSTGTPKGVAVAHRSIVRLVVETDFAEFGPQEVFLQFAPVSFDASTLEIWGPLLHGGRLAIVPAEKPSLEELRELIARHGITTMWLTAGLFHQMVEENPEGLRSLRQLLAGGDVLSVPHVEKTLRELDGIRLINGYGPTENTTFTCCHAMRGLRQFPGSIPIGRPIANTQVYVVDRYGGLAPQGAAGELLIGGLGLARGYLDRPAASAEKFVPHRFGAEPGSRLYRSGDLARFTADGRLQFLGRIDGQVKVRGFRIELGEIETVLRQVPGVREVAVVALPDPAGNKRLTAYLVPEPDARPAVSELSGYLSGVLPPHALPSYYVFLERLPLTPNGKLDRRALPAPEEAADRLEEYEAPRTHIEAKLLGIWQEVLGVERIGIHDDFFELGGHSLLATQMISKLRKTLGADVDLQIVFEAPSVAAMASRLEESLAHPAPPPILPAERRDQLPMSFAQQRLWFLDRLVPNNSFYNIAASWKLIGLLDVPTLECCLGEILRRHEALRTRFPAQAGQPTQIIAPEARLPLKLVDLSGLEADAREREAVRLNTEEALRPFDLSCGPLLRATLLWLRDGEAGLVITMHHIVSDGWSMGVFQKELTALYEAFLARKPSPLAELAVQYADFAIWQRQWLRDAVLEEHLAHWDRRLAEVSTLNLPTDRPRPAMQAFRGGRLPFELSPELSARFRTVSREHGATLYMTLLAAFQALLCRRSGQTDVVVGSPIANRNHPGTEAIIGFFVNTLAMRADLSGNPSFRELLGQVRETALEAYAYQDLPFEKLVDHLRIERDLSRNPIFQVVFALQNAASGHVSMADLKVLPLSEEARTTRFDLELHLWEGPEILDGMFLFDMDLFDPATVSRLAEHFRLMLEGIAADPDRRLSQLPLLTPEERRQMLVEWNDVRAEYDTRICLHELFEARAAQRPGAVAVVGSGQRLSYRELNVRANRLAHRLIELGVGPETLVGVCLERSPEVVVALMAILKAGGAYVPIDPEYPRERIEFILDDVGAPVLLTRSAIAASLSDLKALPLCLDQEEDADRSEENPPRRAGSDNTAYIIFTSGSTGRPKGVVLQHRPVINLIEWVNHRFQIGPADRVLMVASLWFDLSVYDVFGLLAAGGSIHVASDEEVRDAPALAGILDSGSITFWDSAPAALQQLVPFLPAAGQGSPELRLAFLSGDWIPLTLPPALVKAFPNLRVIGLGGATEAAIWSNFHPIDEVRPEWVSIPYGRAIQNARYYVLDEDLHPCPLGVAGNLYIGGECLSLGYFNRPRLSAERYVPDPFSERPGAVLYGTGDRARWRAQGHIEFLGRLDNQVKIRGYRIELGEIEAALIEGAGVEQCVVTAWEDPSGARRLVAYLATGERTIPDADELRDLLRQKLPSYMIPSAFVALESLPLTPNGKVDRRALPAPESARSGAERAVVTPRTPTEILLARIWSEVLQCDEISVDDNFFAIGGDSILSIGIVGQAIQAGLSLTPQEIFEHQTIAELAAVIDAAQPDSQERVTEPMAPPAERQPFALADIEPDRLDRLVGGDPRIADLYPLSPMQQDMLVHSLAFADSDVNFLQFCWSSKSALDVPALRRTWQRIFERHDALRTAFRWQGLKEPLQLVYREIEAPWEEHDWRDLPRDRQPDRLQTFLREDHRRGFPLDQPQLARLSLIRMADFDSLVWSIHHALVDGWSLGLIVKEFLDLYETFHHGRESEWTPPRPYRDYIAWLQHQDLGKAEAYWRKALRGLTTPSPLWIDKIPASCPRSGQIERCVNGLSEAQTAALGSLAQQSHLTLGTLLQGAWALLVSRYGGEGEVSFGITVSGRPAELAGVDSMVGLFINNLPVRVEVSPDDLLRSWLQRLHRHLAELRQYETTSQANIRAWSEVPGELPLFETMVVFGNYSVDESVVDPSSSTAPWSEGDGGAGLAHYFGARTSSRLTLISQPSRRLQLDLVYDGGLFDATSIDRMSGHLQTLLEGIVAADDTERLGELPLLSAAERSQLVTEPGNAAHEREALRELIAARARRLPPAAAKKARGMRLSPGIRIHLLDSHRRLVPLGVPGEAYLGGARIMQSTLDRLAMSAEKLVPGPFGEPAGTRLYRTGKLARRLPDGRIEWLGDLDRAVRAQGTTLLPEVVEAALSKHPDVDEAAVWTAQDRPGETRLVACLVASGESPPGVSALQSFLKEKLPWHLLPAEWHLMAPELVPRTANGEIDRQALVELRASGARIGLDEHGRNLLFQDPVEAQLLQIWKELFSIRPLGVDDDFFQLGGNSVLAVSLVAKIQERLGLDLPLSALFSGSTVKQLAQMLREQADEMPFSPLVSVKPDGSGPPLFCVHAAGGNVLGFHELVRHLDRDQPFYALQSLGLDGRQEPSTSIVEMASRYIEEIRTVQAQGPYYLGGHSFGGYVAYEMACQLHRQGQQVALLALLDVWSPVFQGRPILDESMPDPAGVLAAVVNRSAQLYGKEYSISREQIAAIDAAEQLDYALEQMETAGIDPGVDRDRVRRLLKIQLSSLQAMRRWVPEPYPGRITVFRAMEDDVLLMETNRHPALGDPDLHQGWTALSSQPILILDVPGNHGTMLLEPDVRVLGQLLTTCIDELREAS